VKKLKEGKSESGKFEKGEKVLFTFPPFTYCLSLLPAAWSAAHWTRPCVHRSLLTEASAVSLASVYRLELRFLSRRDEVSVFLKILDDLFADHLAFEPAQCALDGFVRVNCYVSHLSSHLLSAKISARKANGN